MIDHAKFFYIGGFFLTHGIESAMHVAKVASSSGKAVALNLSAPFIPQFFKVQLDQILLHVDIIIGNETEAEAYAESHGMTDSTIPQIAQTLANLPKNNASRPRLVIITQGSESTVVASSNASASKCNIHPGEENPKTYTVTKLPDDKIVDTNAAGDAFAGGFLAAHVAGKDLDHCVEAGHKMAAMCIQEIGPQFKWPKVQVL